MSGFLFDTNVLLDIATCDPFWLEWSENQFRTAAAKGPILINPIIYAELTPAFACVVDLDRWLEYHHADLKNRTETGGRASRNPRLSAVIPAG